STVRTLTARSTLAHVQSRDGTPRGASSGPMVDTADDPRWTNAFIISRRWGRRRALPRNAVECGDFERLACQCESPHLTAVYVNQVWAAPPLPQEASQSRHCVSSPSVTRPSAAGTGHRGYGYCLTHGMIEDSGSRGRGGW